MDVREKLVELILNADNDKNLGFYDLYDLTHERTGGAEYFADCLIANGVTVQEYKLGVKKTNADRIRSMSDEELAMFLCNFRSCNADEYICEGCKAEKYCRAGHEGTIDWLQQPAEVSK